MPEVTSITVTENTLYNLTVTEASGTTLTLTVPGVETIINTSMNEIDAVMQNNGAGKGVYKTKDSATFVMRSINDDDKTIDVDYANSDNEVKIKLPDAGISTPDGFTINADSDNTAKIELPGSTVDLSKAKLLTDLDVNTKDLDNVGTVTATDITVSGTAAVTGDFQIGSTMSVYGTAVFNADSHMSSGKRFSTDKLNVSSDSTINQATIATVDINSGSIDNTTVGATTSSTGRFTTVGTTSLTADTADINAGSIDNTTVGATTSSTGRFSTLESASVDLNGGHIDGVIIGQNNPVTIVTSDLTATTADINGGNIDGTIIGATHQRALHTSDLTADTADINAGTIDGTVVGATTPAAVSTTSLVATTVDINAGTIDNTRIGGVTPVLGTFTTVEATTGAITTVNSTNVNSTNLDVGTGTVDTLIATTADINAGTIDNTVIGATTPAVGTFTTANATTGNITTVNSTNVNSTNLDVDTGTIDNFTSTTIGGATVNTTDVNATGTGTIGTLNVTGNTTLAGDLTVNGTTTTVNTETINLADNNILLNSNHTGTPTEDSGITINRGTEIDSEFHWNETSDRWQANYLQQYTTVSAGSFVIGTQYTILTHGTTTENQWNSTAGTVWGTPRPIGSTFTATNDSGSGTGTATYAVPLVYADLKINDLELAGDVVANNITALGTFSVAGTFSTNQDLITAQNITVTGTGAATGTGVIKSPTFVGTLVGQFDANSQPVGSRINSTGGEFVELTSMEDTEFCIHSGDVGIGSDDAGVGGWGQWIGNHPADLKMNGFGSIVWPWTDYSEGNQYASIGVTVPRHNYNQPHGGDMTITVPHGLLVDGFLNGFEMQVDGDLDVTGTVDANGGDFNSLTVGSVMTDLLPAKANEVAHPHDPIVYNLGSATKEWDNLYLEEAGTIKMDGTTVLSELNGDVIVHTDILPTVDNTQYLGSATKRWHSLHLGPGSLYIDGVKVLGSSTGSQIDITTDTDQNLNISAGAAGTAGAITLSSAGNTTTINDTTVNLGPSTASGTINARGTLEAPDLHIGDLEFSANKIDRTATDGNLEIATNGTGYLHANVADLYVGPIAGAVKIDENSISVSNTNGDLNLTSNGTGKILLDDLTVDNANSGYGESQIKLSTPVNHVIALETSGSGYIYNLAPQTWIGDGAGAFFTSTSGSATTLKPFGGQNLSIEGNSTPGGFLSVSLSGDLTANLTNTKAIAANKNGLTIPGVTQWGGWNLLTGNDGISSASKPNTGYPFVGISQTASGQGQPTAQYLINHMDYDISGGLASGSGVQVRFAAQDESGKLIDIASNLCKLRNTTVSGSSGSSTVDTWDSEYTLTVTSNAGSGASDVGTNVLTTNVDFTEVSQELRVVNKPGNSGNTALSGVYLTYDGAETGNPSAILQLRDNDAAANVESIKLEEARTTFGAVTKQYKASSDPSGEAGDTYFNTTTSKFRGHNGTAWVDLG